MTATASHDPARRARLTASTPAQFLPGIGPGRAALLARLGIATLEDLLQHVPREYLDARRTVPIARIPGSGLVTVVARVDHVETRRSRGRSDLVARVSDDTGVLGVRWFGQGFLSKAIEVGKTLALVGELAPGPARSFLNPLFEPLGDDPKSAGRILPRHPLTAGVTAHAMRRWVRAALDALRDELAAEDPLPAELRAELGLPGLADAYEAVHFPESPEAAERARKRLAFDELFLAQLVLVLRRRARAEVSQALVTARGMERARAAIAALPFEPTGAQRRAVNEIVKDMKAPRAMHRMLVGDVGTGKTVVALLAAVCACEAGFQVAVMAPTEILAEQHFRTLSALGEAAGIVPALWTGSTAEAARRELRKRLRLPSGDPFALDLVVGTHALLEEEVPLPRLGLVVVDEQHRFGVRQRAQLAKKGSGFPDVLVMTATPIPRSLALAFLGDLDVTVLDERPKDRIPIVTRVSTEARREAVYRFLADELDEGAPGLRRLSPHRGEREERAARRQGDAREPRGAPGARRLPVRPLARPHEARREGGRHGRLRREPDPGARRDHRDRGRRRRAERDGDDHRTPGTLRPDAAPSAARPRRPRHRALGVRPARGPAERARGPRAPRPPGFDGRRLPSRRGRSQDARLRRTVGRAPDRLARAARRRPRARPRPRRPRARRGRGPRRRRSLVAVAGACAPARPARAPVRRGTVVEGDRMNGWHVHCPACGAEYLLPEPFARPGARVRCPGCGAAFRAADPRHARMLREAVYAWAAAQPGGVDAVRAARAAGTFWQTYGVSFSAALEPHGDDGPRSDAAALEAALSSLLGPGSRLL